MLKFLSAVSHCKKGSVIHQICRLKYSGVNVNIAEMLFIKKNPNISYFCWYNRGCLFLLYIPVNRSKRLSQINWVWNCLEYLSENILLGWYVWTIDYLLGWLPSVHVINPSFQNINLCALRPEWKICTTQVLAHLEKFLSICKMPFHATLASLNKKYTLIYVFQDGHITLDRLHKHCTTPIFGL